MIYNLQQEKKIGTLKIKQKAGREEGWSDKSTKYMAKMSPVALVFSTNINEKAYPLKFRVLNRILLIHYT